MLFADDIVLVNEIISGINAKLEIWWDTLESKRFWLGRAKIECMECKLSKSKNKNKNKGMVRLDGQEILKSDSFQYLGSIIHKD